MKNNDSLARCTVCNSDFSIAHGGLNDCRRHVEVSSSSFIYSILLFISTVFRYKSKVMFCREISYPWPPFLLGGGGGGGGRDRQGVVLSGYLPEMLFCRLRCLVWFISCLDTKSLFYSILFHNQVVNPYYYYCYYYYL